MCIVHGLYGYMCVVICIYVGIAGIDFGEFPNMYKRLFSKGVVCVCIYTWLYVFMYVVICIHVCVGGINFSEFQHIQVPVSTQ